MRANQMERQSSTDSKACVQIACRYHCTDRIFHYIGVVVGRYHPVSSIFDIQFTLSENEVSENCSQYIPVCSVFRVVLYFSVFFRLFCWRIHWQWIPGKRLEYRGMDIYVQFSEYIKAMYRQGKILISNMFPYIS